MTELQPIRDIPEDYERIERAIEILFRDEIYLPLVRELGAPKQVLRNSLDDLADAIASGHISFSRGKFTGKFSAAASKELKRLGATWIRKDSAWSLPASRHPIEITNAIHQSISRFEQVLGRIDRKLQQLLPEEIADKVKLTDLFDKSLWKMDKQITKQLTVAPELTPKRREEIAEEYTTNMKLYIKDWVEKEIVELRKKVQAKVFSGNRYESMVKIIRDSYGVSQRKAKFLARQETNLLMAKFKTARYTDVGITHYKWRSVVGSPNHPVRPRHKELNDESRAGKLFRFDDPPVQADGNKKNPGEDYNCRCVAIPVVRF